MCAALLSFFVFSLFGLVVFCGWRIYRWARFELIGEYQVHADRQRGKIRGKVGVFFFLIIFGLRGFSKIFNLTEYSGHHF